VPGLPVDDLVQIDDGKGVPLAGTNVLVQTPQVFAELPLLEAYKRAAEEGFEGTDTSACVTRFSALRVRNVPGEQQNFKIT
jgi:2-C-methyl-D-erythritol 4-phosphate cytidylyltransferase